MVQLIDTQATLIAVRSRPWPVHVAPTALHGIVEAAQLSLRVGVAVLLLGDKYYTGVRAGGGREQAEEKDRKSKKEGS